MVDEKGLGTDGDDFYELLMQAHEGLSEQQSHALNARLVLILANHIGNQQVLSKALTLAKNTKPA